jgi:soluble lytic murein transglycosylase-like protein
MDTLPRLAWMNSMNRSPLWLLVAALFLGSCDGDRAADVAEPAAEPTLSATPSQRPTPTPRPDPYRLAKSYDAGSPALLASRIEDSERAIRSDDRSAHAEAARIQQASYRQLVRTPEWRQEVYERLPTDVRAIARANVEAGAELRALTQPRTELPPWHIVEPPGPDELRSHYDAAAKEFSIGWSYLAAIHLTETRMGRIRGDSHAGARGPMQFLPSTWAAYGKGDINDPRDAIFAAARYLEAHGAPGDMSRALFAYNHSDHYVRAITVYAEQMSKDARAYDGYYHWQVYYRTTKGDALLYEGWPSK